MGFQKNHKFTPQTFAHHEKKNSFCNGTKHKKYSLKFSALRGVPPKKNGQKWELGRQNMPIFEKWALPKNGYMPIFFKKNIGAHLPHWLNVD